jgi:hypothetical protein
MLGGGGATGQIGANRAVVEGLSALGGATAATGGMLALGAYWTDPLGPMHGMTPGGDIMGAISPFCTEVGWETHGMYAGVAAAMGTDCSTSVNGALVLLLGRGAAVGPGPLGGGTRTVEGLSALGAAAELGAGLGLAVSGCCGAGVSTSPRFTIRSSVGEGDGSHETGGKVV